MSKNRLILFTTVIFSVLVFNLRVSGNDHADLLKPYLTNDVVAIVYLDVSEWKTAATIQQLEQFGVVGEELANLKAVAKQADLELASLSKSGVRMVYALLRTSDLNDGGTVWVFPVAEGHDVQVAKKTLQDLFSKLPPLSQTINEVRTSEGAVLAAANARQLEQMTGPQPDAPRDLSAAWEALGSGAAGIVVVGDVDSRKVVRALFPALPAPFESITGGLVADHLDWGGIEIKLPPELAAKVEIQAADQETAKVLAAAIRDGVSALGQLPHFQSIIPEAEQAGVLAALEPKVDGTRTTVSLEDITGDIERLAKVLAGPISNVKNKAQIQDEMNRLRQLALAMHNFESAYQHFPSPDGKSERTPAGLSWRVHILPFIEEMELYKQFNLDEPWDSEHNLKLVKQMPRIYKSQMPGHAKTNAEGKTIYQVPFCSKAIFRPGAEKPISFKEMTDGSSNTILLATVAAEHAAIWTRPDDWEIDLEDPWQKLKNGTRESVVVAHADGSVHVYPTSVKSEKLRALITADGGEIVD